MTLRSVAGQLTGETADDLLAWMRDLTDCPPVTRAVVARCERSVHGDDQPTWFYVEADATEGVARRRCLACGDVRHLLDSADRWTYPSAWSCVTCSQAIAEVGIGFHEVDGRADWVVMTLRCVECGNLEGATDAIISPPSKTDSLLDLV